MLKRSYILLMFIYGILIPVPAFSGADILFSSFLGGLDLDLILDMDLDSSSNIYVTGITKSPDFPTINAVQGTFKGGEFDIFVTKVDPAAPAIIYSTFLGGTGEEWRWSEDFLPKIAVDKYGNAYVSGQTSSTDYPTFNALQPLPASTYDRFITKLSPSGSDLVYSTYLGGSDDDFGSGIAVDADGNAYVLGTTISTDFPTMNAYQKFIFSFGWCDVFLSKLTADGTGMAYSTYFGGGSGDYGYDIAVNRDGYAYITGMSFSSFPLTNLYHYTCGSSGGIFAICFNEYGSDIVWSTCINGSDYEQGLSITVDKTDNCYVTGETASSDLPTSNAYQGSFGGGTLDGFLAKIDNMGNMMYVTFLGGSDQDGGLALDTDDYGDVYAGGYTYSGDFPTQDFFKTSPGPGFLTKFNSAGDTMLFSWFLDTDCEAFFRDVSGDFYLAGSTNTSGFPTRNAVQPIFAGNVDGAIMKLRHIPLYPTPTVSPTPVASLDNHSMNCIILIFFTFLLCVIPVVLTHTGRTFKK